jgi:hypothetical protein
MRYLRKSNIYPDTRELESSPPVRINRAWTVWEAGQYICTILDTPWGYRASVDAWTQWVGCWYTSRKSCRDSVKPSIA